MRDDVDGWMGSRDGCNLVADWIRKSGGCVWLTSSRVWLLAAHQKCCKGGNEHTLYHQDIWPAVVGRARGSWWEGDMKRPEKMPLGVGILFPICGSVTG